MVQYCLSPQSRQMPSLNLLSGTPQMLQRGGVFFGFVRMYFLGIFFHQVVAPRKPLALAMGRSGATSFLLLLLYDVIIVSFQ